MTNTDITTIHWPRSVLFIEELPGKPVTNPAALARIFGITSYLHVIWEEGKLRHKASSSDLNITLAETGASAEQFYADIFAGPQPPEQIFRLRNPVFPLPALFVEEFSNDLPPADYRYALSQGSAYGMTGFFAERISSEAFRVLNAAPGDLLLPNGCFNGLSLPDGGKHYFSDRLQRYYLLENFELLFESPRMLVVDAVSRCNYACRKCPFHAPSSLLDQREVMPVSQYTRLLEKAAAYPRLTTCAPTLTGEPLVHPHITELTRLTRQAGYNFSFTTNASLLTPQLADELLEAGVGPLAFSVDATNQQTYQNLQQGNLAQVERNILDFQSRFLARYGYFSGTMSFVVSAENAHEQEAYKQKWLSRGFHVTFYARHDCQRNMRPYTLFLPRAPRRSPCLASWHTLFLNRAMQAVTCSWGSWATSPTAQSPTLVDRDAGLFWRKNPAYTTFAEHGRKLQKHCGHCTNWAEMQRQLTRTPQGELVSTALGSQTWIPSTENKTNG